MNDNKLPNKNLEDLLRDKVEEFIHLENNNDIKNNKLDILKNYFNKTKDYLTDSNKLDILKSYFNKTKDYLTDSNKLDILKSYFNKTKDYLTGSRARLITSSSLSGLLLITYLTLTILGCNNRRLKKYRSEYNLFIEQIESGNINEDLIRTHNRDLKSYYDKRNNLIRNLNSKLADYKTLIDRGPIQENININNYSSNRPYPGHGLDTKYIQSELELKTILYELKNSNHLGEDRDSIEKTINSYLSNIQQKYVILKDSIIDYFNSETIRWESLANSGKYEEAKRVNKNLTRQMSEFEKSELNSLTR
jgi:hypothetical protein